MHFKIESGQQTFDLIKNKDHRESFQKWSEAALEELDESGCVEEIPILGKLMKASRIILSIQDRIFLKRLGQVFQELEKVDQKTIDEFTKKLDDDNEREEFIEHLIVIVNQTESEYKARIIAVLFKRMLCGLISRDNFDFLTFAVSRTYLHSLYTLYRSKNNPNLLDKNLGMSLASLRLVDVSIEAFIKLDKQTGGVSKDVELGIPDVRNLYKINHQGNLLCDALAEIVVHDPTD